MSAETGPPEHGSESPYRSERDRSLSSTRVAEPDDAERAGEPPPPDTPSSSPASGATETEPPEATLSEPVDRLRGNGRGEPRDGQGVGLDVPPPPSPTPPSPPIDLRVDGLPPPPVDAAAGLPATPYPRHAPAAGRQRRMRRPDRVPPARAEGRWVAHRLIQVSPWSVFKIVVLFYVCVFLMFMVAGVLLWRIGRSTEAIDQVEGLVTRLGAYGRCVPEAEVEPGTNFETDEDCPDGEVIVDGFRFDDGTLLRSSVLAGVVFVIAGTAITVLLTVLLNLLNDVTGGLRYEVVREPTPPPSRSTGR